MSKYSVPKNVFLQLLMISMLYTAVISLMVVLTNYVNVLFPDQLDYYVNYFDSIRFSSSALFVSFPIFLLLNFFIGKETKEFPEVKDSGIRKWLIYLTLFVSAVTMVIYLIRLVFNFYGGELTLPFFLKVMVVIVLTAIVFVYYLMDLSNRIHKPRIFAYVSSFFVLLTILLGFFLVGSPAQQRQVRFDLERENSLSEIQWQIVNFWQYKGALPENLLDLNDGLTGYFVSVDPETQENYEYKVLSDLSFELCANFSTSNVDSYPDTTREVKPFASSGLAGSNSWAHGTGRICFERTIDPDFYKLLEK